MVAAVAGVLLGGCADGSSTTTESRTVTTTATRRGADDALIFVKSIYDPYARADDVGTLLLGDCFLERVCPQLDSFVTPELKAKLLRYARRGTGSDPIDCAQNTPVRVEYDPPVRSGTAVTVVVHTIYGMSGDNPIKVVVDLNTLRLSDLVCLGSIEEVDGTSATSARPRLRRSLRAKWSRSHSSRYMEHATRSDQGRAEIATPVIGALRFAGTPGR